MSISFGIKEQLLIVLQNVSEVRRERSRLTAASSVYDSTKHNGLVSPFFCRTHLCRRFTVFVTKYNLMSKDNLIVPMTESDLNPDESDA